MGTWKIIIPEAATNLITNPSFELGTVGWAGAGTNTIARSSARSKFGSYSALVTYQDSVAPLVQTALFDLPAASVTYTITAWVRPASNWDGGNISLDTAAFAGAVNTVVSQWTAGTDALDEWKMIQSTVAVDADVNGRVRLVASSAPTAGRTVYFDAVQLEQKAYATTYCDGDQPGCAWNGARHASTSERNEFEATGGRVRDFADDLDLTIENEFGTGIPPVINLSSPLARQAGAAHEGQSIGSRLLTFQSSIIGSSTQNYHDKRQAIYKALNSQPGKINQPSRPRTIRYTGDVTQKEARAVYHDGLQGVGNRGFAEQPINLALLCDDPLFYQVGNNSQALDTNDSGTFRGIAAKIDGQWTNLGISNNFATFAAVYAIVASGDYVYVGGEFTDLDGIAAADNIARYNKTTGVWSALDTGLSGVCFDLAVEADGNIIAVGNFTTAAAVTVRDVARWNVTTEAWSALGPPSTDSAGVWAVAIHPVTGDVYIGGTFTDFDGIANADRLARWDGAAWAALSTGANDNVRALAFGPDGTLYVGGDFTTLGGVTVNRAGTWNGTSFAIMGEGFTSGGVMSLLVAADGSIYAGGSFTASGTQSPLRISRFNGVSWQEMNTGVNSTVFSLANSPDGRLWLGGQFTAYGPAGVFTSFDGLLNWNGSRYSLPDLNIVDSNVIRTIHFDGEDMYIGFTDASTVVNHSGAATVAYAGTAPAWPTIVIERSGGTSAILQGIANHTTGAELLFNRYQLANDERLTIILEPSKVAVHSSIAGNQWNTMLPQSNLGQFYLTPGNAAGNQDNKITAFIDTAGSPTITSFIQWKDTFISSDG